jgi:hypothetical protein
MIKTIKAFLLAIAGAFMMSPAMVKPIDVSDQPHLIRIKILFNTPPSYVNIKKAKLKYDKEFAYSLTLDDGLDDAYTAAFFLLNGGLVEGNGKTYPGLYYSDGCGNKIPFRAGLAWHTANPEGKDLHETPGYMTWDQLKEVYAQGWNVMNHSYTHANGAGTDYNFQITKNIEYVKEKTGINMTHFVIPQGDVNYTDYAFANNMKAVFSEPGFPGGGGISIDNLTNLVNFKLHRTFITDNNLSTDNIDRIANKSSPTEHYWYNEFTHRVGFNQTGGSLIFSNFEKHMNHIDQNYGLSGSDRMWMAPLQDVYEYLNVRNKTAISGQLNETAYWIDLDFSTLSDDLEKYALTLVIDTDQPFETIGINSDAHYSFNGADSKKIINMEWNKKPLNNGSDPLASKEPKEIPFEVYPIPASEKIEILISKESGPYEYVLVDNTGKILQTGKNIRKQKFTIDLKNLELENGTYYLRLYSKEFGVFTKPIVIIN